MTKAFMNNTPEKLRSGIYLDSSLDLQIRIKAAQNRQTISDFVAEALIHYLNNYETIKANP